MPEQTGPFPPTVDEQTKEPDGAVHRKASVLSVVIGHPYTIISTVLLLIMGLGVTLKHNSAWDVTGLEASRMLMRGEDFYTIAWYRYPPFETWFNIPFTWMPPRLARLAWSVISIASFLYLVRKSWRLAGGGRIEPIGQTPTSGWREQLAFLLGLACALQFALNTLTHLQTDLLIAALLMAGCGAIAAGRFGRAATWIGIATAFKATPLLFAPYLLWRRQWLAAAWLVVLAVGVNLLPDTVHRPPGGGTWLSHWYGQYLEPMQNPDYLPGDWKNQLVNNQGFAGSAKRWLVTSWRAEPRNFRVFDRPTHPGPAVVRGFYLGSCLTALIPVALGLWRRRQRMNHAKLSNAASGSTVTHGGAAHPLLALSSLPSAPMIECGMVLLLMLLFSPNSSRAHFCVMFLSAFCVARGAMYWGSRGLRWMIALAAISSMLSYHLRLPFTFAAEQFLLWVGVVMFSAIFLLVGSAIELPKATA